MTTNRRLPSIQPYALPTDGEWPASRADWALEPGRAALLIHDMQRYFVDAFTPDAEHRLLHPAALCARHVHMSNVTLRAGAHRAVFRATACQSAEKKQPLCIGLLAYSHATQPAAAPIHWRDWLVGLLPLLIDNVTRARTPRPGRPAPR